MNLSDIKKVYISGIGGIGVSALARYFFNKNIEVVGSDLVRSEITEKLEKLGITIYYEQKAENLTYAFDLLVYSAAVPAENTERQKAKELNILQKSYFEMIGELSRLYKTVAVSGTNGKSTTTAMIAGILLDAQIDPTVIVGSQYEKLDSNFHFGKSDIFVVEACEYRAHMLLLKPQCIILTNIEEDHLDFYKDINHIVQTFQQYVNSLKQVDDLLIINNDDINTRNLVLPKCRLVRYGLIPGADVVAGRVRKEPGKQVFEVIYYGHSLGDFELQVPGNFNIYNALAAISYALSLDVPVGVVRESLKNYRGIWRRFEVIKNDEFTVISDYAHHPTAVSSTIEAAKEFFPGRRVIAVFQPHQRDRTQKLFSDFTKSFNKADLLILSEIYDVTGREEKNVEVSSRDLVFAILEDDPVKEVHYGADLVETLSKVNSLVRPDDVVLIMGAGDIYQIASKIHIDSQDAEG
ncbi:MAG: UDP-N-acetylmuramate-L-alanine ligase [Parcubacteria group bacterium GW2011_GWC2_39_14]|nr:MAG: UDP-N-acetylmuramate-L-alanine ligase [Parcubacteria group bacterium GW2011_GWC2_39_14]KKR54558.1 MAG: UDP-N-acetylmuramate-L-alanine ligase [Parcubacteria group bacterium GW2011_GWA2_40_23]